MAEKNRNGLRAVEESDMEEYRQKLREHRRKVIKRMSILILAVLSMAAGAWIFFSLRHYEAYDVRSSVERSDTEATRFEEFRGNILKYSNDGAFYTDASNGLIWNQTYEMSSPETDICGEYLVIYDRRGTQIYILTPDGLQGSIETTMPVTQVCVAEQGVIAVLMQSDATGHLALYDKSGRNLASGAIYGEKGGYPVAIALSRDAIRLAVSMLDINDAGIRSTIAFYNYSAAGQNEIDNCVGVSTFPDMVIPEMKFTSDERMVAFGDSEIILFEGASRPQAVMEIPLEKQARSIFYNEKYIGVVTAGGDETVTYHLTVYDTRGRMIMEQDFDMEYETIEFLSGNEICIRNPHACAIYTLQGIYKFYSEFQEELCKVIPGISGLDYTFVLSHATEKVRLK